MEGRLFVRARKKIGGRLQVNVGFRGMGELIVDNEGGNEREKEIRELQRVNSKVKKDNS